MITILDVYSCTIECNISLLLKMLYKWNAHILHTQKIVSLHSLSLQVGSKNPTNTTVLYAVRRTPSYKHKRNWSSLSSNLPMMLCLHKLSFSITGQFPKSFPITSYDCGSSAVVVGRPLVWFVRQVSILRKWGEVIGHLPDTISGVKPL